MSAAITPRRVPVALRVVEREARIYRRIWRGTAFTYFVGPVLYLAAMGVGLGGLVAASGTRVDDLSYLQWVAPGLLAGTVMQSIAGEALWPTMAGMKWFRFYHSMAASPMTPSDIYTGNLLWMLCKPIASGTVFVFVAVLFGAVASPWAVAAIPAAVLCGAAFAAPLSAFSASQDTDAPFQLVMRFGILPLFLFSGTFFPVSQLPPVLQGLAWASPLWHGVELCRSAMTGVVPPGGLAVLVAHVAFLSALVVLGRLWGIRTFAAKLAP